MSQRSFLCDFVACPAIRKPNVEFDHAGNKIYADEKDLQEMRARIRAIFVLGVTK